MYDGQLLDAHLTRSMYKHMLGLPVVVSDVEAIDPTYYQSLVWILKNDITDVLELTFAIDVEEYGERKVEFDRGGGSEGVVGVMSRLKERGTFRNNDFFSP